MEYSLLKDAVKKDYLLPFFMEMTKYAPNLIEDMLIKPLLEEMRNPLPKEDKSENKETAEVIFAKLLSYTDVSSTSDIDFLYKKVKEAGVIFTDKFIVELLGSSKPGKYIGIFKDYWPAVKRNANKHIRYELVDDNITMFFLNKGNLELAEFAFRESGESLDNLIPRLGLKHLPMFVELANKIDNSKSETEYMIEYYEKIINHTLENFKNRYDGYSSKNVRILKDIKFIDFFKNNISWMKEDLIIKSFYVALKDENTVDNITKITKGLKILKSSVEYSNFIVGALDKKTSLHSFKDDFYKFPASFWEKENLIGGNGSELSKGMKIISDWELHKGLWDQKSIDKVRGIYEKNIFPHLEDIYKDYLDRRCFENKEFQSNNAGVISSFFDGSSKFVTSLESYNELYAFIKYYTKDIDLNNDADYQKIENVIDFYLSKHSKDCDNVTWISRDGLRRGSRDVSMCLSSNHPNPLEVFNVLSDYKDIILNNIAERKSTLDNNLLLSAKVLGKVTENDIANANIKFSYDNLNSLQEVDKSSIVASTEYRQNELNAETIRHSLFYKDIFNEAQKAEMRTVLEYLLLEKEIPSAPMMPSRSVKF